MIINVTYGGSARDTAHYIEGAAKEHGREVPGTEDRATLLGGQGFEFPVENRDDVRLALDVMRRDVELQASNTKPIQNTVIHASMSWPQGYEPSREEMLDAPEHLAKAWGMEAHRRISWSHGETLHRHVHTIFGQPHPVTGYAHHDHELNDRAQRAAIDWERKHGIPPTRQKDHDKAVAAEASDHARTMALSRNTDGSILRRSLDRALSLGGHFGPDKIAQRKEFMERNGLTKFPRHHGQAYAPPEVAAEKRDYISKNREHSSNLTRAYNREGKERAAGVFRLYEDHSFEKTSKPPAQEEREKDMGRINDALDWPWKKVGKIVWEKWDDWQHNRAIRDGMNNPDNYMSRAQQEEFKRETEKRGHKRDREEKREPSFPSPHLAQENRLAKHFKTMEERPRPERPQPLPPSTPTPEEERLKKEKEYEDARIKNWKTQRERRDKEEGGRSPKEPPWRTDERRTEQWRQQKEQERDEANSVPIPKLSPDKDRVYRPQSREPPALPRPQEIPMPKIESRDHAPATNQQKPKQPQAQGLPREWWKAARELEDIARGILAKSQSKSQEPPQHQQEPKPMNPIEQGGMNKEVSKARESAVDERNKGRANDPEKQSQQWDETLDKREENLRKSWPDLPIDNGPGQQPTKDVKDTLLSSATGRHHDPNQYIQGKGQPHYPVPTPSREESRADGTAGKGRQDRTEAGQPGLLPGGSHEHGSPTRQFRDQLNESLKKIKPPVQEIGKDRERER